MSLSTTTKPLLKTATTTTTVPEIEQAHQLACAEKKDLYIDPITGLSVFTSYAAIKRGYCCGRGCRHCPYSHVNVSDVSRRINTSSEPILIPAINPPTTTNSSKNKFKPTTTSTNKRRRPPQFILSWSGGKDSYLSLLHLVANYYENDREKARQDIVFLTTFDYETRAVPEQNISLDDVLDQVTKHLQFDLLLIPLRGKCDNITYVNTVKRGIELIEKETAHDDDDEQEQRSSSSSTTTISKSILVFGDLHLTDIRNWREENFHDRKCLFPIFNIPYSDLKQILFSQTEVQEILISKVNHPVLRDVLKVMEYKTKFDVKFCDEVIKLQLTTTSEATATITSIVDEFGEKGEFHTFVKFI
jgi:diphthamide synthase (EF-2-diphthine--ammonia ligase)